MEKIVIGKNAKISLDNFLIKDGYIYVGGRKLKIIRKDYINKIGCGEKIFTTKIVNKTVYFITTIDEKELKRTEIPQFG
jgi:hypothetical protein